MEGKWPSLTWDTKVIVLCCPCSPKHCHLNDPSPRGKISLPPQIKWQNVHLFIHTINVHAIYSTTFYPNAFTVMQYMRNNTTVCFSKDWIACQRNAHGKHQWNKEKKLSSTKSIKSRVFERFGALMMRDLNLYRGNSGFFGEWAM